MVKTKEMARKICLLLFGILRKMVRTLACCFWKTHGPPKKKPKKNMELFTDEYLFKSFGSHGYQMIGILEQ